MPDDQVTDEPQINVTPAMVDEAKSEFDAVSKGIIDLLQFYSGTKIGFLNPDGTQRLVTVPNPGDLSENTVYKPILGDNIENYVGLMRQFVVNTQSADISSRFFDNPNVTPEENEQNRQAHFDHEVNFRVAKMIVVEQARNLYLQDDSVKEKFLEETDVSNVTQEQANALFEQYCLNLASQNMANGTLLNGVPGGLSVQQYQDAVRDVAVNTGVLDADRQRQIDEVNAHNSRMVRFSDEIRTAKYELAETARALGLGDRIIEMARERFGDAAADNIDFQWHDGMINSPDIQQMLRDEMNRVAGEIMMKNPQQDGEEMDAYMERLKGVMVEHMAENLDVSLEEEGVKERLSGLFDRYNRNMATLETDARNLEQEAQEAEAKAAADAPENDAKGERPEPDSRIESLEKGLAQLVPGLNGLGTKEIDLIITKISVDLSAPRENPMPGEADGVLDQQTFQSYQHVMQHLNYLVALKEAGASAATNPPSKLSQSMAYVPEKREVLEELLEEEANNQIKAQEELLANAPADKKAEIQAEIDRLTKMRDEDLPKFLDDMASLHAEGKLTADNVYTPSGVESGPKEPEITQAEKDAEAERQRLTGLDNTIKLVEGKLAPLVSKIEGMIPMGLGKGLVSAIDQNDRDAQGHEVFGQSSQDAVAKMVMFINTSRGIENANGVYDPSMREGMIRDILTKPELAMIRQELGVQQMDEATAADYFGNISAGASDEDRADRQAMRERIENSAQYKDSLKTLNDTFTALDTLHQNNLLDQQRSANTTMNNMYFQAGVNLLNQFDPSLTQWLADFFQNDEWGQMAAGLLASFGINVAILWGDDQTPVQEIAQNSVAQQYDRYYEDAEAKTGSSDFSTVMAEVRTKMLGDLDGANATFKLAIDQIFNGQGEETIKAALEKALDAADAAGNKDAAREAFAQSIIQSGQDFQNGVTAEAVAALKESLGTGGDAPASGNTGAEGPESESLLSRLAGGISSLLPDSVKNIDLENLTSAENLSSAVSLVGGLFDSLKENLPALGSDFAKAAVGELEQLGQDLADAGQELQDQETSSEVKTLSGEQLDAIRNGTEHLAQGDSSSMTMERNLNEEAAAGPQVLDIAQSANVAMFNGASGVSQYDPSAAFAEASRDMGIDGQIPDGLEMDDPRLRTDNTVGMGVA